MSTPIDKKSSASTSTSSSSHQKHRQQPPPHETVKHLTPLPNETIEQNLDDVLATVKHLDQKCCFSKCKMKTNLMGQDCTYCRERFCFKHSLPEIHGCGQAVRHDERKKFLHPEPVKKQREREDVEKAKNRLHVKLKEMNLTRKQKQPSGNSKAKDKKT